MFKEPMLAAKIVDLSDLRFPLMASPKIDGIRAIIRDGQVMSRSMKLIPNAYVQFLFGQPEFEGLDGELIFGKPTDPDVFRQTTSAVMSHEGEPKITFWVFDDTLIQTEPFWRRHQQVVERVSDLQTPDVQALDHYPVEDVVELLRLQSAWTAQGFEGVMLRGPEAPYKQGRSTLKEHGLIKLKKFEDGEAEIVGIIELMHNANEAQTNEVGRTKRSSAKAGKVPAGTMGALAVRDRQTGIEFEIGTGFTMEDRNTFWSLRETAIGQLVKYKYFAVGVKDKPRHPVFIGLRDVRDM